MNLNSSDPCSLRGFRKLRFRAFSRYHEENPPPVPLAVPVQPPAPDRPFMRKVAEYNTWFQQSCGHLDPAARSVVMLGKFVCDLDCANYMLTNSQKLMIAMLLDGEEMARAQEADLSL